MKVVLRFTMREEAKALPILLRHSPGMVLKDRTYIVSADAVRALIEAGIIPEAELETYGSDESRLPMSSALMMAKFSFSSKNSAKTSVCRRK